MERNRDKWEFYLIIKWFYLKIKCLSRWLINQLLSDSKRLKHSQVQITDTKDFIVRERKKILMHNENPLSFNLVRGMS